MKAPDWLRRAFWQGAKRVLRKGLPSSSNVRNDYYDTCLDPCEARLPYRSAVPPERGTSISRDQLLLKLASPRSSLKGTPTCSPQMKAAFTRRRDIYKTQIKNE